MMLHYKENIKILLALLNVHIRDYHLRADTYSLKLPLYCTVYSYIATLYIITRIIISQK